MLEMDTRSIKDMIKDMKKTMQQNAQLLIKNEAEKERVKEVEALAKKREEEFMQKLKDVDSKFITPL